MSDSYKYKTVFHPGLEITFPKFLIMVIGSFFRLETLLFRRSMDHRQFLADHWSVIGCYFKLCFLGLLCLWLNRQSTRLSPQISWVRFPLWTLWYPYSEKSPSTVCRKSWVFSGYSGFLPQGIESLSKTTKYKDEGILDNFCRLHIILRILSWTSLVVAQRVFPCVAVYEYWP